MQKMKKTGLISYMDLNNYNSKHQILTFVKLEPYILFQFCTNFYKVYLR